MDALIALVSGARANLVPSSRTLDAWPACHSMSQHVTACHGRVWLYICVAGAGSESIGSSAEELIIMTLMATAPTLLQVFSHSAALKRVDEWLAKAAAAESNGRTVQLLTLLAKMPMTVSALQVSFPRAHAPSKRVLC